MEVMPGAAMGAQPDGGARTARDGHEAGAPGYAPAGREEQDFPPEPD